MDVHTWIFFTAGKQTRKTATDALCQRRYLLFSINISKALKEQSTCKCAVWGSNVIASDKAVLISIITSLQTLPL